jgi:hypothetical protein
MNFIPSLLAALRKAIELGAMLLGPVLPIVLALLAPDVLTTRTSAEVMVEVVAGLDDAVVARLAGWLTRSRGEPSL